MVDTGYSMPSIQEPRRPGTKAPYRSYKKRRKNFRSRFSPAFLIVTVRVFTNSQALIDANGNIIAKYRKTHLVTAAPLDERPYFTAGDGFASCKIDKFNLGLGICYDLRFPEFYRTLAVNHGTNVLVNSSAWPFPRVEHLRILAMARAIENQSYLVLANRVGTDDEVTFCGTSAIIDPYGAIVAAASVDREELIQAELSEEVVNSVRSGMAVFAHRRRIFTGCRGSRAGCTSKDFATRYALPQREKNCT